MIKNWIVLLLVFGCYVLHAQTVKTDVLVIGGSAGGVAAAIQSARSKVKTILAAPDIKIPAAANTITIIYGNRSVPSGIWGEFREHVYDFYKKKPGIDTAYNAPLKFERAIGDSIINAMADTAKNLTVDINTTFNEIKRDGDRWEVRLFKNGRTLIVKAKVVIDATENGGVALKAGKKFNPAGDIGSEELYRTSIAAVDDLPGGGHDYAEHNYPPIPAYSVPMYALLLNGADNLLVIKKATANSAFEYLPLQLELGQGAGAIAAYCAFFKTTTQNLKVRIIQGELLDFKAYLLPFADVLQKDPHWRAIQQVCATGLLKGIRQAEGNDSIFVFKPDSLVSTAEIKPVLTEIYTRAFLWFNREKPGERFTIGNLLSFISDYTLTEPDILKGSVQKAWKTQYKFKLDFDLKRQINRYEFAVLANRYLNPFARTVDMNGRLMN